MWRIWNVVPVVMYRFLIFDEENNRPKQYQYHWKVRKQVYQCFSTKVLFAHTCELIHHTMKYLIGEQDAKCIYLCKDNLGDVSDQIITSNHCIG